MNKKYFGTDGIRGEVGNPPITPDFMLKLGWAFGNVLSKKISTKEKLEVIIGKDTRVSGYMFESALEAGLVSSGVDVRLLGPMPTPAVATITCMMKASAGIVISASHNAYSDNGVKFFDKDGEKICDHDELAIEAKIEEKLVTVSSDSLGKASRIDTADEMYMNFCKSTVKNNFLTKLEINDSLDTIDNLLILFDKNKTPQLAYEIADLNTQIGDFATAKTKIEYGLANVKDDMKRAFYETQQPYETSLKAAFLYLKALVIFNEDKDNNVETALATLNHALVIDPNFNMAIISKEALLSRKKGE